MKTPNLLIACILIGSSLLSEAVEKAPTIRISDDWIIISQFVNSQQVGALPSTCAVRKSSITSACIQTDPEALYPNDGSKIKNHDGDSAEELAALRAIISITTTEMDADGRNKTYQISGLTNGTAPEFLQKIIEAAKKLEGPEGVK